MAAEPPPVRRAERKRAEQAQEMRGDIMDAAFSEFAERGYHATTIADIARRLGISPASFYNYFKNKRDIVDHVIDRLLEQLVGALQADNAPQVAETAEEYAEQSRRIASAVDVIFSADNRVPRFLLLEATSIDPELTERVFSLFDLAGRLGEAYLRNGIERGFLRPDINVPATADAISGMVLSVAIRTLRSKLSDDDRQAWHETVVTLLLYGVAERPAAPPSG